MTIPPRLRLHNGRRLCRTTILEKRERERKRVLKRPHRFVCDRSPAWGKRKKGVGAGARAGATARQKKAPSTIPVGSMSTRRKEKGKRARRSSCPLFELHTKNTRLKHELLEGRREKEKKKRGEGGFFEIIGIINSAGSRKSDVAGAIGTIDAREETGKKEKIASRGSRSAAPPPPKKGGKPQQGARSAKG